MDKICEFTINDKTYTIYNVDRIEGKESYVGQTTYNHGVIFIEYGTWKQMLLTLKHELMHVWLYENGHWNQTKKCNFNYEELCELVALSNDSINRIVREYKKTIKHLFPLLFM